MTAVAIAAVVVPPSAVAAQEVAALVSRTDSLLGAMDLAGARQAIDAARRAAPKDHEVLWRLSRVYNLLGDEQGDKGETFYLQAHAFAEQAIAANPNVAAGYVRRAAASGKVALFRGTLEAADFVKATREDAEKAIALGDGGPLQQASAHYILGRAHLKLLETPRPLRVPVGLGWARLDSAVTHLRRAVEMRPDFVMFQLEYGRALEKSGDIAGARRAFQAASTLPPAEVGDEARRAEAAADLRRLGGA